MDEFNIITDRQLLIIVLNNLLENACKYSNPVSSIEVEFTSQAESSIVKIEVRNIPGGSGWPDPEKVFEKYYRSPQTKRQSGTGLGLFLAHDLSRILGGRIQYLPDDTWVRFILELPEKFSSPTSDDSKTTHKECRDISAICSMQTLYGT